MKPGSTIDALTCLLNSSIAALTRDASAAASTLSPQAGQKSPRTAGIVVVSPLYV
jgi:hypothetical protein